MDQTWAWLVSGGVALLVLSAAAWRWGWLHGPLLVVLALWSVGSATAALFFAYGFFAWKAQGGGMMLMLVLPAAVAAWVAWVLLRMVWRSRSSAHSFDGSIYLDLAKRFKQATRGSGGT